jgi:predicted alpha/beta-hydrolase family hydrolase
MITSQFDLEFTKDGSVHQQQQVTSLLSGLTGASDLLVLVHGWNNDLDDARKLYNDFIASFDKLPQIPSGSGSKIVVLRVFWPSKKFTDEELIPGGGAASANAQNDTALRQALEALKEDPDRLGEHGNDPVRAANIDRALDVIDELEESESARREFVLRIRAVLNPDHAHEEDASREFFELEPEKLFEQFAQEVPVALRVGEGGAANVNEGGAAFLGDLLSGMKAAGRRIANFATYYQMKTRAGTVGKAGLAAMLVRIRERYPELPIHLVGHSFGGRVATAAAAALQTGGAPVTLTLLQAAFSHNGLAEKFDGEKNGAFRTILQDKRISGPIVITHTKNDMAVGIAYPLASRIAFDNAAALGDENDPYGGMGRNGAQHTPELSTSEFQLRDLATEQKYVFAPRKVYNLNADEIIRDHSDVTSVPVVNVLLHVLLAPQSHV